VYRQGCRAVAGALVLTADGPRATRAITATARQ
jgi:hypothetical protein